jgi:seryl-tRNA synthetase
MSSDILSLDEARRACIQAAEAALAERNAASKDVGRAKAGGDEAEFERLRALVAAKKDEIAALEEEAKEKDAACATCSPASRTCPMTTSPTARTRTTTSRFTAGAPRRASTSSRRSISS